MIVQVTLYCRRHRSQSYSAYNYIYVHNTVRNIETIIVQVDHVSTAGSHMTLVGVTSWDWVKRVPPQPRLSPLEANHRASFETFDAVLAYTATTIVNSVRVCFFTVAGLSWRVSVNIHARSSVYKLRLEVCFICPTVLYLPQLCYICPWLAEYSTVVSTPETGYS